jgi:hypothetical protein
MAHNRKLVIGGVTLTTARSNRHDIAVGTEVQDELERVMMATRFLENAPFQWVGLILRYGLKNDEKPTYQRINQKHGDLPVAIELDTRELQHASREELKDIFTIATLRVLIDIGQEFGLPTDEFRAMLRQKLGGAPGSNN